MDAVRALPRRQRLASGLDVVATAASGDDAAAKIERLSPQGALVDVRMPGFPGIESSAAPRRGCRARR
ncbi:MAG: hypothetical protein ICV67_03025 [Thermoleophilia bacterium]|nr:hypothetical protein [Thermoleophilia bacterium]